MGADQLSRAISLRPSDTNICIRTVANGIMIPMTGWISSPRTFLIRATSITRSAIGGSFVLLGVNSQFRRQSESALRALRVEIDANRLAADLMTQAWAAGGPHFISAACRTFGIAQSEEGSSIPVRTGNLAGDGGEAAIDLALVAETVRQSDRGVPSAAPELDQSGSRTKAAGLQQRRRQFAASIGIG